MARTMQTARTPTGGRPPRRRFISSDSEVEDPDEAPVVYTKQDTAAWTERSGVREEIETLLEKHNKDQPNCRFPFTPAELITMAVLCSRKYGLGCQEIMRWIIKSVASYRGRALNAFVALYGEFHDGDDYEMIQRLKEGFDCYDAPFMWVRTEAADYDDICLVTTDEVKEYDLPITVPTTAGRIFLRRWLEPERNGTFSFLNLPAELRNAVYDLVLTFPESGISVEPEGNHVMALHEREVDSVTPRIDSFNNIIINSRQALAVLSINKQVYKEAMPIYYSRNNFRFDNITSLLRFASGSGIDRFQHVGGLELHTSTFDFTWMDPSLDVLPLSKVEANGVGMLAKLKTPHRVVMKLQGRDLNWMSRNRHFRNAVGVTVKPQQLLALKELAMAGGKAKAFEIESGCEQIKEYLTTTAKRLGAGEPIDEIEHASKGKKGRKKVRAAGPIITKASQRRSARLRK